MITLIYIISSECTKITGEWMTDSSCHLMADISITLTLGDYNTY